MILPDQTYNGFRVESPADDNIPPRSWTVVCKNYHRIFATNSMIESGEVICAECARDAAQYARLQQRRRDADELLASGNEYTEAFEAIIAADRLERER